MPAANPLLPLSVMSQSVISNVAVPLGVNPTPQFELVRLLIFIFCRCSVPEPVKFTLAPIPLHGTLFVSSMPSKSNPLRITVTEVPLMVMKETPPSSELLPMLLSQLTVSDLLIPRPPKLPESAQVISPPVVVLLYAPLKLAHGVGRSQLLASLPLDATQV